MVFPANQEDTVFTKAAQTGMVTRVREQLCKEETRSWRHNWRKPTVGTKKFYANESMRRSLYKKVKCDVG